MTTAGCDPDQSELSDKLEDVSRRLRQIEEAIEALPVGFVLFDADDRLILKNRKNCLFDDSGVLEQPGTKFVDWLRFGLTADNLPELERDTEAWIRRRIEQHKEGDNKLIQELADGRSIQIEEMKIRDGSVVGTYTDVTDIVKIELSLRESELKLRQINSSFPGAMFQYVMAADGPRRITFISEQCQQFLGVTAQEVYDNPMAARRFVPDEDSKRMERSMRQAFVADRPWTEEFRVQRDGNTRWMRGNSIPTKMDDGSTAWNGVLVEITDAKNIEASLQVAQSTLSERVAERARDLQKEIVERRRIEEELRQAKDLADAANRAKTDFLANMSHELRTPLNAIIGFSDLMRNEVFGAVGVDRYKGYLAVISGSASHLLDIISDILDIAWVESGKYVLESTEFSLNELVEETIRFLDQSSFQSGVTISSVTALSVDLFRADRRAVRQMLLNLLSNAIKFTLDGGSVEVSSVVDKTTTSLSVRDNGIGIAAQHFKNLARPFFQVEQSLTRGREGTGLGLALTKTLIELHGGQMLIESELGTGTTVTLVFPNSTGLTAL